MYPPSTEVYGENTLMYVFFLAQSDSTRTECCCKATQHSGAFRKPVLPNPMH